MVYVNCYSLRCQTFLLKEVVLHFDCTFSGTLICIYFYFLWIPKVAEAHVPAFIFDEFRTILWRSGWGISSEDHAFVCSGFFFHCSLQTFWLIILRGALVLLIKRNDCCSVQVSQWTRMHITRTLKLQQLNGIQPPFIYLFFLTSNYGSISFMKKKPVKLFTYTFYWSLMF